MSRRRKSPEGAGGAIKQRPKPVSAAAFQINHDALVGAVPHPIAVLDREGTFAYANPAAESFFAASLSKLRQKRLEDLVSFGCPLMSLVEQVRRTGASLNEYGVEISTPRADTPVRLVDVYASPMTDADGATFLMMQQRTMAQMIERQLTHRAAARSVSGLAAVLAHEIKNPLSGIRGAAQLIEPGLEDQDRGLAQLICAETDRIRDLVDRMEVFGDDRPLQKEPINVHDVLDHVRRLAENGFASHIQFSEQYDPSLPPVAGIRDKLIQALLNLVKNAAEAISETGEKSGRIMLRTGYRPGVRLSVPGSGSRVSLPLMIEIEDNGAGVPPDMIKSLFDPFVTSKSSGKGLGLALVAKIIGDHGGIIECESEPRQTVFRALLPLHDEKA
ncbi:MAG: ATP-binding protein [Pseudomonadota bacterium]